MKHSYITRRRILVNGAKALAGLTLAGSCRSFNESAKDTPHGFKLAVCDWTIGNRASPASLEVAKRIGLDGVQVDFGKAEDVLPLFDTDLQRQFLDEQRKQDVQIASLAMGVLNNIPYKSDPRAEKWVADGIDVCRTLGVKVVLLACFGNGDLKDDKKGTDFVVERLKRVAPKAEKAGVILGIESWLSADQHMDIIQRVGSKNVKVYYDVANSHKAGYDIYTEIRQLGKHICEFHAKDYDDLYGKGSIDFVKVREAMDDIGYRGWFVMEGVKMPLGVEESCKYDAEYLRGIFPPVV
ncbi:MAG: sugar phosphate isomerase/epimerase [Planctomycetes bacterium]|nr:sugar phosphate isomerase/epimerase [Planctomycetota bacterium]